VLGSPPVRMYAISTAPRTEATHCSGIIAISLQHERALQELSAKELDGEDTEPDVEQGESEEVVGDARERGDRIGCAEVVLDDPGLSSHLGGGPASFDA
jgi:hypothetical protein